MSAKSLLIAHGEKLVLVVVAAGCVYALSNSLGDPAYRPKDNAQRIDDINANIDKVFATQEPPVIQEPRPYADQLLVRLGEAPPVAPLMAWTTVPPDRSTGQSKDGPYFYVYELPVPEVALRDAVGQLEVTVTLPALDDKAASAVRRVSAEPVREWTRTDKGTVSNTAHQLGVCLELSIGDPNNFKPLVLPGASKDGILPLTALGQPLLYATGEPWQKHFVRARLVAAATSFDLKTTEPRPRATVLVWPGIASVTLLEDQKLLDSLTGQWNAKKGGPLFDKVLKPETGLALPEGAVVAANERVFRGPGPTAIPAVTVTASVRFALTGLGSEMKENQSRDIANFLFVKRFIRGAEAKWMEKPIPLKFGEGDKLGDKVQVTNPFNEKQKVEADFSTPFVVTKLLKAQPRINYWLVRAKSRAAGGRDKDLELDKKETQTDIVVLKNPASGKEMILSKLVRITPPAQANVVVYPYRTGPVDEREEFAKDPSGFQQYDITPAEPTAYEPGTGPLAKLAKEKAGSIDASTYETDTTYYAMPDGRLVWWDKVNHELGRYDPNNIEKPASEAPPAPPAPVAPPVAPVAPKPPVAPKGPPGVPGMPPGMPPGMMPPGGPPQPPHR